MPLAQVQPGLGQLAAPPLSKGPPLDSNPGRWGTPRADKRSRWFSRIPWCWAAFRAASCPHLSSLALLRNRRGFW